MNRTSQRQWKAMLEPPPKYSRDVGSVIEGGDPIQESESVMEGVPNGSSDLPFTFTPSYLPEEESKDIEITYKSIEWKYHVASGHVRYFNAMYNVAKTISADDDGRYREIWSQMSDSYNGLDITIGGYLGEGMCGFPLGINKVSPIGEYLTLEPESTIEFAESFEFGGDDEFINSLDWVDNLWEIEDGEIDGYYTNAYYEGNASGGNLGHTVSGKIYFMHPRLAHNYEDNNCVYLFEDEEGGTEELDHYYRDREEPYAIGLSIDIGTSSNDDFIRPDRDPIEVGEEVGGYADFHMKCRIDYTIETDVYTLKITTNCDNNPKLNVEFELRSMYPLKLRCLSEDYYNEGWQYYTDLELGDYVEYEYSYSRKYVGERLGYYPYDWFWSPRYENRIGSITGALEYTSTENNPNNFGINVQPIFETEDKIVLPYKNIPIIATSNFNLEAIYGDTMRGGTNVKYPEAGEYVIATDGSNALMLGEVSSEGLMSTYFGGLHSTMPSNSRQNLFSTYECYYNSFVNFKQPRSGTSYYGFDARKLYVDELNERDFEIDEEDGAKLNYIYPPITYGQNWASANFGSMVWGVDPRTKPKFPNGGTSCYISFIDEFFGKNAPEIYWEDNAVHGLNYFANDDLTGQTYIPRYSTLTICGVQLDDSTIIVGGSPQENIVKATTRDEIIDNYPIYIELTASPNRIILYGAEQYMTGSQRIYFRLYRRNQVRDNGDGTTDYMHWRYFHNFSEIFFRILPQKGTYAY